MDILMEVPWECDDKDCSREWHLETYALTEEGGYEVSYYGPGDCDWDLCEELPSDEEVTEAWKQYYLYCAETGQDPLCNFSMMHLYSKTKVSWELKFSTRNEGLYLDGARKLGSYLWLAKPELPGYLQEVLDYDIHQLGSGYKVITNSVNTLDDLVKYGGLKKTAKNIAVFEIEETTKPTMEQIKAAIKNAAKKALSSNLA